MLALSSMRVRLSSKVTETFTTLLHQLLCLLTVNQDQKEKKIVPYHTTLP